MKDLRFSITAIAAFTAFSLYLIGMNEAEDTFTIATLSLLLILAGLFTATSDE